MTGPFRVRYICGLIFFIFVLNSNAALTEKHKNIVLVDHIGNKIAFSRYADRVFGKYKDKLQITQTVVQLDIVEPNEPMKSITFNPEFCYNYLDEVTCPGYYNATFVAEAIISCDQNLHPHYPFMEQDKKYVRYAIRLPKGLQRKKTSFILHFELSRMFPRMLSDYLGINVNNLKSDTANVGKLVNTSDSTTVSGLGLDGLLRFEHKLYKTAKTDIPYNNTYFVPLQRIEIVPAELYEGRFLNVDYTGLEKIHMEVEWVGGEKLVELFAVVSLRLGIWRDGWLHLWGFVFSGLLFVTTFTCMLLKLGLECSCYLAANAISRKLSPKITGSFIGSTLSASSFNSNRCSSVQFGDDITATISARSCLLIDTTTSNTVIATNSTGYNTYPVILNLQTQESLESFDVTFLI